MYAVNDKGEVRVIETDDPVLAVQKANFFSDLVSDEPVRISGPFVMCGRWTAMRSDIGIIAVVWDGKDIETYAGVSVIVGKEITKVSTGDVNADLLASLRHAALGRRGAVMHPSVGKFERAGGF